MNPPGETCQLCGVAVSGNMVAHVQGKKHQRLVTMKNKEEADAARTVFVRGFLPYITPDMVTKYFSSFGKVTQVFVNKEKGNYAFVQFASAETRNFVVNMSHHQSMLGPRLTVRPKVVRNVTPQKQNNDKRFASDPAVNPSFNINYEDVSKALRQTESVEKQILLVQELLELRPVDIEQRQRIVNSIQSVFQNRIHGCSVKQFGSSVNGFGVRGCDMDLFLDLKLEAAPSPHPAQPQGAAAQPPMLRVDEVGPKLHAALAAATVMQRVNYVYKMLQRSELRLAQLMKIPAVRCPVVQFIDADSGIHCDLSVNNRLALRNTQLLKLLCQIDWRVRPLIFALRYFFKFQELSGGSSGSQRLSSYAVCWLIITYLQQCRPPVLPSIKHLAQLAEGSEQSTTDGWDTSFTERLNLLKSPSNLNPDSPDQPKPASAEPNSETEHPDPGNDKGSNDDEKPASAPQKVNESTLTELLTGFFHCYSTVDLANTVICPKVGSFLSVKEFVNMSKSEPAQEEFKLSFVNIQDPFVLSHNLAQNLNEKMGEILADEVKEATAKCMCTQFSTTGEEHNWGLTFLVSNERLTKPPVSITRGKKLTQNLPSGFDYTLDFEFRGNLIPRELFTKSCSVHEVKVTWAHEVCQLLMYTLEKVLLFVCTISSEDNPGLEPPTQDPEVGDGKGKKRASSDSTPDEPDEKRQCAEAEEKLSPSYHCSGGTHDIAKNAEPLQSASSQLACNDVSSEHSQQSDSQQASNSDADIIYRSTGKSEKDTILSSTDSLSNTNQKKQSPTDDSQSPTDDSQSPTDNSQYTANDSQSPADGPQSPTESVAERPTKHSTASQKSAEKTNSGEKPDVLLLASCSCVHQSWAGRKRVKKVIRASGVPMDDTLSSELLVTKRLQDELGAGGPHAVIEFDLKVLRTISESGKCSVSIQMRPTLAPKLFTSFYQYFRTFFTKLKDNSLFLPGGLPKKGQ